MSSKLEHISGFYLLLPVLILLDSLKRPIESDFTLSTIESIFARRRNYVLIQRILFGQARVDFTRPLSGRTGLDASYPKNVPKWHSKVHCCASCDLCAYFSRSWSACNRLGTSSWEASTARAMREYVLQGCMWWFHRSWKLSIFLLIQHNLNLWVLIPM